MNYFIHTIKGNKTVIYNKITGSNDTVYPDILINHPFAEDEIADDTLFHIADEAIRQYGNGKVIIAKVADDNDLDYILKTMACLYPGNVKESSGYIDDFCKNILLSETMALNFKKLMQYYKETGCNPHDLLAPFIKEYALPVKSKKEGKIIYELIRNQILG